jgi:hypothetical protein
MHALIPFLFPAACAVSAMAFVMCGQAADRAAKRELAALEQLSHGNEQPPSSTALDCVKAIMLAGLFLGLVILTFSLS